MKRKLSILLASLLLVLVSCTSRNPKLFFGDGKCYLPCWYGLIPNQTTLSEATKILTSLPIINGQSVEVKSLTIIAPPKVVASWDFIGDTIGNGHLSFDTDNILEYTLIRPTGLYLGDVVDILGNPSGVWAVYHRDPGGLYYFLTVFYPERGISVETIGPPARNESNTGNEDVNRNMIVSEIRLYDPSRGVEYYFTERLFLPQREAQSYIKHLLPWPGFGKDVIHVEKLTLDDIR